MLASGEWHKVFESMLFSAAVGIIVGLIRASIDLKSYEHNAKTVIKTIFASLLAAELVSLSIYDFSFGLHSKVALTSICAYVANDILLGIRKTGKMIGENPLDFFRAIKELVTGGNRGQHEDRNPPSTPDQRKEP